MCNAAQDTDRKASPFVLKREPATVAPQESATNGCQFFNLATDCSDLESTNSADAERFEEIWLPDYQRRLLGNSYCSAQTDGGDNPARDLSQNSTDAAQQLDTQVEALVLGNSDSAGACDTELVLRRLLATVFGQAAAASSIARQYARATNIIRTEVCSALGACQSQCSRLFSSRRTYMSSLRHLHKIQKEMLFCQQACMLCKNSLLKDLLELESLRCTAKRLQDSRHLIESMKLSSQHEACRSLLGQKTASNSNGLEKHFLAEKAALQLRHVSYFSRFHTFILFAAHTNASRLLNVQETLSVLRQSCPVEEYAARKILCRLEQAAYRETNQCAGKSIQGTCGVHHGGLKAVEPSASSPFTEDSCASCACLVSLLRLLDLEKKLSVKFSTDSKRLLHLTRLARNFACAWEHLEKFLESVLGPMPHAGYLDGKSDSCQYQWGGGCVEQNNQFWERPSDTSINPATRGLEWPRTGLPQFQAMAQYRLSMIGVAFSNGALRRAQRSPLGSAIIPSCLEKLKSPSVTHFCARSEALPSFRWNARSGLGTERAALYRSSCATVSHVRLAEKTFRSLATIEDTEADKIYSRPPSRRNKTGPEVSKDAALSPKGQPDYSALEIQDSDLLMLRSRAEAVVCVNKHTNTQCQLRNAAALSGGASTLGKSSNKDTHASSETEEESRKCRAQGIPACGVTPEFALPTNRSFGDSEVPSYSSRSERTRNISQSLPWHRGSHFASLLKTTGEKLNSVSNEVFSKYYGTKKPSQGATTKGSCKISSTFVDMQSRLRCRRRYVCPHQHPTKSLRKLQSLIENVGKKSCRRVIRQWVSMKGRDPRTSPRSSGRSLWKNRHEVPCSHMISSATPVESGGHVNRII